MTVTQIVERERLRLRRAYLVAGGATVAAATLGILALASAGLGGARWLALPRILPFVVWGAIAAVDVAIVIVAGRWLARRATSGGVAETIERERSLRAGALRGVLEVGESGELGRAAAAAMEQRLSGTSPLMPSTDATARSRIARSAATALGAGILLIGTTAFAGDGLRVLLRPFSAWNGSILPAIELRNLPDAILRGETLRLELVAPGRAHVTLTQRSPGEPWRTQTLTVDEHGSAIAPVGPIRGDVTLFVSDGRAATDTVIVHVTDRPFVGAVSIRAIYPAYLGRAPEMLPFGEPARLPLATLLEISGRASTALRSIALVNGLDTLRLAPSGHAFAGRMEAKVSGSWSWLAGAASGNIADVPSPVELEVIPDSAPRVDLMTPVADTIVAPTDRVAIQAAALDDHGIGSVDLVTWRVSGASATKRESRPIAATHEPIWRGGTVLDLSQQSLQPGDVLHVLIVATDDSPWRQRGESRELLLKVPTSEERRDLARQLGDSAVAAAQAIAAAQRALERRTQDAARDRGDRSQDQASAASAADKEVSFEAAEKTRALAKEQRALTDEVKSLEQSARALEKQLQQAGALDTSLARQLEEAQSLLREALTPELLAQMQKLESSAQQMSREESQATLEELRQQQKRLREQLEKSAEMLKRAALEGAMQTLSDEAKDLAARQRQLADSIAARVLGDTSAAAKIESQRLADRTDKLGSEMQKLEDRLVRDRAEAGATRTEQARQQTQSSEDKLRAGNQTGSAAEDMKRAAQAMQDARSQQVQEWKRELTSELDRAIQEMLQMSREETALEQRAKNGETKSDELRGQQSAVKQGLDEAAQRLQREAQKSSLLSGRSQRAVAEAQQRVEQATQQASQNQGGGTQTASSMSEAPDALNRAAASLARDRERANTSGSATGFEEMMRQLQDMANKQGAINSQAQGLFPSGGGQQSAASQATARALARQQRQVAQQLDELGDGAGGDRAARLAQEARQLAEALEGGRVDAATIARQQQLFRRLLDAGRSLEKEDREESDKREAKAGNASDRFTPINKDASGKAATKFREPTWEELRGLSADERRAILEYFKKINGG